MLEVARKSRGGVYLTIEEVATHGEEPVEVVISDEVFYQAGDLMIPSRPDRRTILWRTKVTRCASSTGAHKRDLLEYDFNEPEDGGTNETLTMMTPSSFMSPTKEPRASLSPMVSMSLIKAHQKRGASMLSCYSPRRRKMDESMRVSFLSTLPEEEWERYQSELQRKTGEVWTRVAFMESSWNVIRRCGTQFVMQVGLNQAIMREVIEKMMESTESDSLTESVTEEGAEEILMRDQPVKRAKKGLRKYKSMVRKLRNRVNNKVTNPKVVKSKAAIVVMSLTKMSRPKEIGQMDGVTHSGRAKEKQMPPMLLAGLIYTASKVKKN